MKKLTIDSNQYTQHTIISNSFIDTYMPYANGDFVKVYLYILRCTSTTKHDISTSIIADALHLTEADVIRALRYWQDQDLIKIKQVDDENNTIHIFSPENKETSVNDSKDIKTIETLSPNKTSNIEFSKKPEYKPSELKKLTKDTSVKQLIYVTQRYFGKMLTQNELNTLISFNDWLGLPFDVIEFLVEYCVSNNHKSMRYIEKAAISWAENNIDSIEKAQQFIQVFNKKYFAIMKAFGLGNRNPAFTEIKYMKKWLEQYDFEITLILEACSRTIQAIHQPSFEYADSILESWHKQKVKSFEDVKQLDDIFTKKKKTSNTQKVKSESKFVNYNQRDYNFDELEKKARERLINQVNEGR